MVTPNQESNNMRVSRRVTPSNGFWGVWVTVCSFRNTGTTRDHPALLASAVALTGGQRFVFAVVFFVAVFALFVWPIIKHDNRSDSINAKEQEKARLMKELRKHHD